MAPSGRSRRAQVEDSDEDEKPQRTQPQTQEEDEEMDEDQPQQNGPQNDDEDEDDIPEFDPDTFKDQPLDSAYASNKLKNFIDDWTTLDDKIKGAFPFMRSVAVALEDTQGPETNPMAEKIDLAMRQLLDAREELAIHKAVLGGLRQQVSRNDDITDAEDRYEKALKQNLNAYRNKTSRQKYAADPEYGKFKQEIWEVHHQSEGMMPVKQQIPAEDGDADSDDEDEIEVGGVSQNFTCGLSMTIFKDPMTSKVCGHSFSKEPLQEYFKAIRGGKATCPSTGCSQKLSLADFQIDKELGRRAAAAERRNRHRQMDEDDDEEEEDVV